MNLSTAVFLINDDTRAIMVTYEVDAVGRPAAKTMFKTFDKSIKVDDYVVVPTDTRHNLTVCKVAEVDVDVDFDSSVQVNWIIGRVDLADANQIKEQENAALEAIKSAQKLKKKNELRAALMADNMESLKKLPIAHIDGEIKSLDEPKVA